MKKILSFFLFVFMIYVSFARPVFQFTGTVTKITDGDTIYVSTGGKSFKVRLLGFDTPESYLFPIKDYKYYGCGYPAKKLAIKYLSGSTLGFYADTLSKQEDKYGRKLLYAWVGTGPYGFVVLNNGLGKWYKRENFTFSGEYKKLDEYNKFVKIGMYNVFCSAQDAYIKKNKKYKPIGKFVDEILLSKKDFHYQLQRANFNQLKTLSGQIIVVDPDDANLTGGQLAQLKRKNNIILAYLSIGEAEPYRSYWKKEWVDSDGKLTQRVPDWLGPKNSNWNSYYVRYRLTGWQNLVFSRIDKIKKLGYDGLLLDTLDSYGYWIWEGKDDADDKMVDFVGKIREHLGDYLAIVPNGGLPLVEKTGYLDLINGQLTESLFSLKNKERPDSDKNRQLKYLNKVKDAGKVVMDIEYISGNNNLVCKYYDWIKSKGFLGAVYHLGLDDFQKIKCKKLPACTDANWTCSASCDGIWQKVGTCEGGVIKSGSCGHSCGGGGGYWFRQTSSNFKARKDRTSFQSNKSLKIKQKENIILNKKEIINNLKEKGKDVLKNHFNSQKADLTQTINKKLEDSTIRKIKKDLLKYLKKHGVEDSSLASQVNTLAEKILAYKTGKITRKALELTLNNFLKKIKEVEKKKQIADKIRALQFPINTNHKYKKYENMFKKFFDDKKKKILSNSKYWTEDYYNYLNSFVMYTQWLFSDLEIGNINNIYSYIDWFRKVVGKLRELK